MASASAGRRTVALNRLAGSSDDDLARTADAARELWAPRLRGLRVFDTCRPSRGGLPTRRPRRRSVDAARPCGRQLVGAMADDGDVRREASILHIDLDAFFAAVEQR